MKPEGNRHSQDPSLIDKALNSQGFLEIYIYIFFRLVHGRRKQKQLCRKTFLSESRAAPAALQWGRLLPTRYIPHGHEDPRPQERKEQAGVCNARNKRTQLPALLTLWVCRLFTSNTGTGYGFLSRGHTDSRKHLSHHRLGRWLRRHAADAGENTFHPFLVTSLNLCWNPHIWSTHLCPSHWFLPSTLPTHVCLGSFELLSFQNHSDLITLQSCLKLPDT